MGTSKKIRQKIKAENIYINKRMRKYPWLAYVKWDRRTQTHKRSKDYTEYMCMPKGWRKAFGDLMLEDIDKALIKAGIKDVYCVEQIKEKYGELRWYDYPYPPELDKIISKYAYLSGYTCILCGKPGKMLKHGWISPYCKSCFSKFFGSVYEECVDMTPFDPIFVIHRLDEDEHIDVTDVIKRMKPKYRQEI